MRKRKQENPYGTLLQFDEPTDHVEELAKHHDRVAGSGRNLRAPKIATLQDAYIQQVPEGSSGDFPPPI